MTPPRFVAWLQDSRQSHGSLDPALLTTLTRTADACRAISAQLARGELAGILGLAGSENVQGEDQKKLDIIANDLLLAAHREGTHVAGMASEEMDEPCPSSHPAAPYLLVFDPLDGSSNIDINAPTGTIFSVLRRPAAYSGGDAAAYLQSGRQQVAAGYVLYGAATQLVLTLGHGVFAFTLDPSLDDFVLTGGPLAVPASTREFAINASNQRFWEPPVQRYVDELVSGASGPRGKDFNMRWVAAMVADVHRLLHRGGVFLYPLDSKTASKGGKLRLLYEANPMGWLIEQAGGLASTGRDRILDLQPVTLHQRVPVVLGAREEVEHVQQLHHAAV